MYKIMRRYQVYLNQHSVSLLDEFGEHGNISRSQLIRLTIDQMAQNLAKIFSATKTPPGNKYILDSLVGAIKIKGRKTNFAQNIDEMYLID
ncbi:hypothetical protein A2164_04395 [Candidatus Curtissbacteria bacterium RBG_13_35_7]|uniref:Ribbon-helix-helix protein CopG domain-containing protein n=1 Tax=Candidatus Curtissbacteria bacterium RBG_13_35_7 TaxID=1797705 RepID=A0A1F5G0J4_9BACT|nr:MAG: hypothetical protein A2164_04395 [Candidatus Curtissbacteria bacterium RBG_13_35_7]